MSRSPTAGRPQPCQVAATSEAPHGHLSPDQPLAVNLQFLRRERRGLQGVAVKAVDHHKGSRVRSRPPCLRLLVRLPCRDAGGRRNRGIRACCPRPPARSMTLRLTRRSPGRTRSMLD
jgi:hypothetical protein